MTAVRMLMVCCKCANGILWYLGGIFCVVRGYLHGIYVDYMTCIKHTNGFRP